MVQNIFNQGYAGEIEEIRFAAITNPVLLKKKKNNKLTLPTYENIMEKPVSLAISCLYLF